MYCKFGGEMKDTKIRTPTKRIQSQYNGQIEIINIHNKERLIKQNNMYTETRVNQQPRLMAKSNQKIQGSSGNKKM